MRYYELSKPLSTGMIKTFRGKLAVKVFERERVKSLAIEIQKAAQRKLVMVHAATVLADLLIPPGNQLEKLSSDRAGQHSIRVNDKWRICFVWREGNAYDVEVTDHYR